MDSASTDRAFLPHAHAGDGDRGKYDLSILTGRERLVVELLLQGLGTKQIAARLGRAEATISNQKKNALSRLNVGSAVDLIIQLNHRAIYDPSDTS